MKASPIEIGRNLAQIFSSNFVKQKKNVKEFFRRSVKEATINGVTYEGVAEFIYLGTLISSDNSMEKEIQKTNFGRQ